MIMVVRQAINASNTLRLEKLRRDLHCSNQERLGYQEFGIPSRKSIGPPGKNTIYTDPVGSILNGFS
jgi:hypothetical protein